MYHSFSENCALVQAFDQVLHQVLAFVHGVRFHCCEFMRVGDVHLSLNRMQVAASVFLVHTEMQVVCVLFPSLVDSILLHLPQRFHSAGCHMTAIVRDLHEQNSKLQKRLVVRSAASFCLSRNHQDTDYCFMS